MARPRTSKIGLKAKHFGSKYTKSKNVHRTYTHPGLPRIDVVRVLKTSVEKHINKIDEGKFKTYDVAQYSVDHSPKNLITRNVSKEGILGFPAYFDKGSLKKVADDIKQQMYKKADEELKLAIRRGKDEARLKIKTRNRAFKSKHKSSKEAPGDIYHVLGDSLNFAFMKEDNRGGNRFLRYVAGSYDRDQENPFGEIPKGVYGSRQKKKGKSLTEIYRRGLRGGKRFKDGVIDTPAKRLKGYKFPVKK